MGDGITVSQAFLPHNKGPLCATLGKKGGMLEAGFGRLSRLRRDWCDAWARTTLRAYMSDARSVRGEVEQSLRLGGSGGNPIFVQLFACFL
eukprot:SAG31_NODE_1225_length_9271_cov_10.376472_11_plen_91_part_00